MLEGGQRGGGTCVHMSQEGGFNALGSLVGGKKMELHGRGPNGEKFFL